MIDKETQDAIDKAKLEAQQYADSLAEKYKKADTWWQAYRREHPMAVQNVLIFGGIPLIGAICFFIGRAVGAR